MSLKINDGVGSIFRNDYRTFIPIFSSFGHQRSKLELKLCFTQLHAPQNQRWRQFHIQKRLQNLHTNFQLIWSSNIKVRAKAMFYVVACPSKSKMAMVPYSETTTEPSYQISADLVIKHQSQSFKHFFHIKNSFHIFENMFCNNRL